MITEEDFHQIKQVDHQCNLHLTNHHHSNNNNTVLTAPAMMTQLDQGLLTLIIQINPLVISINHRLFLI